MRFFPCVSLALLLLSRSSILSLSVRYLLIRMCTAVDGHTGMFHSNGPLSPCACVNGSCWRHWRGTRTRRPRRFSWRNIVCYRVEAACGMAPLVTCYLLWLTALLLICQLLGLARSLPLLRLLLPRRGLVRGCKLKTFVASGACRHLLPRGSEPEKRRWGDMMAPAWRGWCGAGACAVMRSCAALRLAAGV